MKKILLATYGISPDPSSVLCTLDIASQLGSEVEIFEVLSPNLDAQIKREGALKLVKSFMEDVMVAVTFAEQKEHEIAKEVIDEAMANLRPFWGKVRDAGLKVDLVIRRGDIVKEIVNYVHVKKDIILAVLSLGKSKKKNKIIKRLEKELDIPLVIVKS